MDLPGSAHSLAFGDCEQCTLYVKSAMGYEIYFKRLVILKCCYDCGIERGTRVDMSDIDPKQSNVGKQPLVLVVEDNEDNLFLATQILSCLGCACACTNNVQTAIDLVQRLKPALVLLDLKLSGDDGLKVVRQLRRDPSTAAIAVIAVTAQAMLGHREQAIAAGCDDYLRKPYMIGELEAIVRQHLKLAKPVTSPIYDVGSLL
ncbi:two-component system response regulator [Leptolyngbya sp. FACHB-261]|uniref:response regulator n=1 Tax=Leptolyngbya sp. FACHB-261 TaxID=2692806 RepID=UPI001689BD62|nr:response regulator [Leptolyngbya sp. FACHB-261]MBD2099458.1 response regulator [Leptolyngbya sp. FACHB-261]